MRISTNVQEKHLLARAIDVNAGLMVGKDIAWQEGLLYKIRALLLACGDTPEHADLYIRQIRARYAHMIANGVGQG